MEVSRFQAGDELVFRKFFNAYYHRVFGFCVKMVSSHHDAEEIALTAFQALFSRCAQFESISRIDGYLFTTMRNLCINHLKHNTRSRQRLREFALEMLNDVSLQNECEIRQPVVEGIDKAIRGLPAACRQIFELIYLEGFSIKEVATHLGVSIDTVYTQQRRAIEKLKLKVTR